MPAWQTYVPLLALVLLFIAVQRGETSFALWACVLLVDLIAVGLALISRSIVTIIVALLRHAHDGGVVDRQRATARRKRHRES